MIIKLMAILAMVCNIVFPANSRRDGFEIKRVNSVEVDTGWDKLTDTATIQLPRNVKGLEREGLRDWIRRGDEVVINLGYNGELKQEFFGFVADVDANIPIKILCEDLMWKLKQVSARYSSSQCNINDLLPKIIPTDLGITLDVADITIGAFKTEKGATVAQVLQKLKDFGIYSYFKGKTLTVGKIYTGTHNIVKYGFQQNISGNSLKYKISDDILIKVTATSTKSNGEQISVTVGDEDGQEQKLSYFNITSEAKLKEMATADLDRLKVSGYSGSIDTFGIPYVEHGWLSEVTDNDYPERSGRYYVDAVKSTFSQSGFKRSVTLGGQFV